MFARRLTLGTLWLTPSTEDESRAIYTGRRLCYGARPSFCGERKSGLDTPAGLVWLNHSFKFFGLTRFGTCFYRRQTDFYSANRYQLSSKLLVSRQVRGLRQTYRRGEPGSRGAA